MRAVLVLLLATGCGFRIGGTAQPDGDVSDDAPIDARVVDAPDAPVDGAVDAPRSWWDPAWGHRRLITIDNTLLAGDVTDFPVLVRIPPANLTGIAQDDCDDLRFVEIDDATTVSLEIDACGVAANKETLVWIKRSLVQSSLAKPTLWLYYGNSSAGRASNGKAVFGSQGAKYESVHHLGSNTADVADNNHNLSTQGGPTAVAGQISEASDFDGNGDYYQLGQGDNAFDFTTTMSASAWVKVTMFTDGWQAIVAKGDSSWRMVRGGTTNAAGFDTNDSNGPQDLNGTKNINDGAWHQVAVVLDAGTKYLYVDGVKDVESTFQTISTNNRNVRIGRNEDQTSRDWYGQIDEVRISGVARDAAWIKAEHLTSTSTTFVQLGADEPY